MSAIRPFNRTQGGIIGLFTRFLPPQPANQEKLDMDWDDVKDYATLSTYVFAILMLIAVIAGITLLRPFPSMRISIISAGVGAFRVVIHHHFHWRYFAPAYKNQRVTWAPWIKGLVSVFLFLIGRSLIKQLPEFALHEEQEFREGAENWTPSQRRRAASLFGLAHLGNLWYPMASIVALGVGGWLFTQYYLRQYSQRYDSEYATFRTAAVHAIYNRIAIYGVGVIIAIALWR